MDRIEEIKKKINTHMPQCRTQAEMMLINEYRDDVPFLLSALAEREKEIEGLKERFSVPIVCICGSTRFKQAWITENARLTGEGNIVLSVGLWGHHERKFPDEKTKKFLDDLHKRKIDLCDWVWVLNVGGYISESTKSEIEYAKNLHKPIRYLSVEFPEYIEPQDPLKLEIARLTGLMVSLYDT